MQENKPKWGDISGDEEEQTVEAVKKPEYEKRPQKPKPQMQTRSEIERLIEKHSEEEILLNIVKCNFEATVEDIIKTFPQFEFVKVENYNPGSFSLVFKSKEAAKEFLYTTKETKIKERGFWIKFPFHYQKGNKIPDNLNREHAPQNQGKKFQDAPSKHPDNYNRKLTGDDTDHQQPTVGLFRSDKAPQQVKPEYKKPQPKKEEDDGWITVEPQHFNRQRQHQQNYRKNNNQQRQQQQQQAPRSKQ